MFWSLFWGVLCFCCCGVFAQTTDFQQNDFERYITISDKYQREGLYDAAASSLALAKDLALQMDSDSLLAEVLNKLGIHHLIQNRYSLALENLQQALDIFQEIQDEEGIAECLNNIASIYYSLGNFHRAKDNYSESLLLRKKGKDKKKLGVSYNNMGIVFSSLEELDSALYYHYKSLDLLQDIGDESGVGLTLSHIGGVMQKKGDLEEALVVLQESFSILNKMDSDIQTIIHVRAEIGLLLAEMGEYDRATEWCEDICKNTSQAIYNHATEKCCHALYIANSSRGDYFEALEFYKMYIATRDSILGTEMIQELTRLELSYAFDQIQLADSLRFEADRNFQQERINKQRIGLFSIGGILFMVAILGLVIYRGKRRSDDLLLNILPIETARELKKSGKAKAKDYSSVTILFSDIIGFTNISESMDPDELVAAVNQYFSAFDAMLEKYGIEKIKTIGDSYMVAGGLPAKSETHAQDVVSLGLEMQTYVEKIKRESMAMGQPYFEMRIGIHSGPVVAGIVGTKKFQYDIWGDTVNTASRIETSGEAGKVNISEATHELIEDHFSCQYRGKVITKGKGELDMYFVKESNGN